MDGTNESMILHKDGAVRVRTFRRLDPAQRWSAGVLECGGSVLQPDPLRPNEVKIGIRVPIPIDPDVPDPPALVDPQERMPKGSPSYSQEKFVGQIWKD